MIIMNPIEQFANTIPTTKNAPLMPPQSSPSNHKQTRRLPASASDSLMSFALSSLKLGRRPRTSGNSNHPGQKKCTRRICRPTPFASAIYIILVLCAIQLKSTASLTTNLVDQRRTRAPGTRPGPARQSSRRRSGDPMSRRPDIRLAEPALCFKEQLRFASIQIPALVQRGTNFVLACVYELEADEQLYSVKWYKGNEEFYKLQIHPPSSIVGSSQEAAEQQATATNHNGQPNQANSWQSTSSINSNQDSLATGPGPSSGQQQQQQYFSQSGVNVRMSLSNATHVHMLNASIESEGSYACEISTQNLSTIRYEKEIRVYALPQSRLNVAGFRQRYSLNDRVELTCSSDFSRPRPALAWFINGQRISNSNQLFELSANVQTKASDQSQVKANLSLRFTLTSDLISRLNQSNASQSIKNDDGQQNNATLAQLAGHSIRLQCKYRLSEVSDVAFADLALSASQLAPSPSRAKHASPTRSFLLSADSSSEIDSSLGPEAAASRRRRRRHGESSSLPVADKTTDGELQEKPDDDDATSSFVLGRPISGQQPEPAADGRLIDSNELDPARPVLHSNLKQAANEHRAADPREATASDWRLAGSAQKRARRGRWAPGKPQQRQATATGPNANSTVFVIKSSQENRLVQSENPIPSELQLRRYFNQHQANRINGNNNQIYSARLNHVGRGVSGPIGVGDTAGQVVACSSGALALHPDDPVLVQVARSSDNSNGPLGSFKSDEGRRKKPHGPNRKQSQNQDQIDSGSDDERDSSEGGVEGAWPNEISASDKHRQLDMNLNYESPPTTANEVGDNEAQIRPSTNANANDPDADHRARMSNEPELDIDCMTIGAVLSGRNRDLNWRADEPQVLHEMGAQNVNEESDNAGADPAMALMKQRGRHHQFTATSEPNPPVGPVQPKLLLCNDYQARRHWSISGKSSLNEPPVDLYHNNNNNNNNQLFNNNNNNQPNANNLRNKNSIWASNQRVAYLNISHHAGSMANPAARANLPSNRQTAPRNRRHSPGFEGNYKFSRSAHELAPLIMSEPDSTAPRSLINAPPLLEWFINNHEAPSSSVNYRPELPLLATTPRASTRKNSAAVQNFTGDLYIDRGDASSDEASSPGLDEEYNSPLNYIDYAEYFANFDSNPMEQQLNLKIKLNKKHFMTPDSKLKLRCSSTQAQILLADAVDLKIVLVSNEHSISDYLQHTTSSWQRRRANNHQANNGFYHSTNNLAKVNNPGSRSSLQQSSKNNVNMSLPNGSMITILVLLATMTIMRMTATIEVVLG